MSRIIFSIVFIFQIMNILCQNKECNRKVRGKTESNLPKGVCIREGHHIIRQHYELIDLNLDGYKDFICNHNIVDRQDGDTIFVSVFFQNLDSTFIESRTFGNIKPLVFNYNKEHPDPKLESLRNVYEYYLGSSIDFADGLIKINVPDGVGEKRVLHYVYHKNEDD